MRRAASLALGRTTKAFDGACALAVMLGAFVVVNMGRAPNGLEEFLAVRITVRNVAFGALLLGIWYLCFTLCGLYRRERGERRARRALRVVVACTAASVMIAPWTAASASGTFSLRVVAAFWAAAVAAELLGRGAIEGIAAYLDRRAAVLRRAVIVGSGPRALQLLHAIDERPVGRLEVIGFVDSCTRDDVPPEIAARLLGSLDALEPTLLSQAIDQVLIALPVKSCYEAIQQTIAVCERVGVEAKYFPDLFSLSLARRAYDEDDELPGVRLQLVADDHRLVVKRVIDVVGALCGIVLLLPVLAACAVAVRLSSPGPVIFSQLRFGHNRRQFRMYKFRTMVQDAERLQGSVEALNEARGPIFKIRDDPRMTRVGRLLRRLSLDELPQLVNVLKGDMSLVGPRPMSLRDVDRFSESWLMRRFSVKPGLTGLWQVNGRSNTDFDRWVRLDLDYIDNWSLALDLRILLKTVPTVISGTGAM